MRPECTPASHTGELRVAHVFTCTAYGNVCSKTRWFHVDHCDVPPDGWCSAQGYDLLEPTARRCAAPETWICDPPRPALYVRLWGAAGSSRDTRDPHSARQSSPSGPARRRARRRKTADPPFNPKRTKSPVQRFANACRLAVHADVEAFRAAFFREHDSPRCPVTDEPLERVTSHVHHDGGLTAFHALVRAFVREKHVNLSRIEYLAGRLLDDSLRGAFVAYHKEHARLMVVSGTANLSHLRKG